MLYTCSKQALILFTGDIDADRFATRSESVPFFPNTRPSGLRRPSAAHIEPFGFLDTPL